jgi:hypothetical protein
LKRNLVTKHRNWPIQKCISREGRERYAFSMSSTLVIALANQLFRVPVNEMLYLKQRYVLLTFYGSQSDFFGSSVPPSSCLTQLIR